jgi:hypothetical protein
MITKDLEHYKLGILDFSKGKEQFEDIPQTWGAYFLQKIGLGS